MRPARLFCIPGLFLLACSGSAPILGAGPPLPSTDGGSTSDAPGPGMESGPPPGDATTAPDAPIDLSTDPKNCGFLGHACEGTCTGGFCDAVATRAFDGDVYALDDTGFYYLKGQSLYVGTVKTTANDQLMATVPSLPGQSNLRQFYTTKSYVYFWNTAGGVTVNKATHAVATFSYVPNSEAFSSVVANDAGLYYLDSSRFLWSAPMTGGTATTDNAWQANGLDADESGVYLQGGPQGGATDGVWRLSGSSSTQLASGATSYWLGLGAQHVYGIAPMGTTIDCQQPSTLWSVPKSGSNGGAGMPATIYASSEYPTLSAADDTSIVWQPCTPGIMSLPSSGGTPHLILAASHAVQVGGPYVYFVDHVGSSVELLRVRR